MPERDAKMRKVSARTYSEVVVTLPDAGELHYYPGSKQLSATCRYHTGDCRRWRSMVKGPRTDGRPVGLLVAWLLSRKKFQSRGDHCDRVSLDSITAQERLQARHYFQQVPGAERILSQEAPP